MVDSPERIGEDIQRNVTGKVEEGAEHVMEQAKEAAAKVQKVGQKSFGEIISKLQEVTYDVFWYIVSPEKVDAVVGLIHMLGFSTAYGMCVWVTFVSSYILGRYLPRQQFGMVQSRIYPVYFRAMAYCVGAALLGHLVSRRMKSLSSMVEMFQGLSLFSALLMVLTNMIWLEPKSTKVCTEIILIDCTALIIIDLISYYIGANHATTFDNSCMTYMLFHIFVFHLIIGFRIFIITYTTTKSN